MLAGINRWFMGRPTGTRVVLSLGVFLAMFGIFGWVLDPAFQAATASGSWPRWRPWAAWPGGSPTTSTIS